MTAYSLYLKFFRARIERIKELSEREKKKLKSKNQRLGISFTKLQNH